MAVFHWWCGFMFAYYIFPGHSLEYAFSCNSFDTLPWYLSIIPFLNTACTYQKCIKLPHSFAVSLQILLQNVILLSMRDLAGKPLWKKILIVVGVWHLQSSAKINVTKLRNMQHCSHWVLNNVCCHDIIISIFSLYQVLLTFNFYFCQYIGVESRLRGLAFTISWSLTEQLPYNVFFQTGYALCWWLSIISHLLSILRIHLWRGVKKLPHIFQYSACKCYGDILHQITLKN